MVTSPSKTLLSHKVPAAVVPAGEASGVKPGSGLALVALNEMVGLVPVVAGVTEPVVGRAVVSDEEVFVGVKVRVGFAAAVCVNWIESCATVVPTTDVFIALISCVGSAVAPKL